MSVAASSSGPGVLSGAQVDAFAGTGFVHAPGFFDTAAMANVDRFVKELAASPERPGLHWVYREDDRNNTGQRVLSRIENFCPFHPGLAGVIGSVRVMAALTQLFGEPAVLFKDKINFKLPGGAGFEPHQDVQAGWDRYAARHITMMVSIDATTLANGCLEMAPGYHDRGIIGEMWTPLDERVPEHAYQACPTSVGDVVFFDAFIPHRSAPNVTRWPRRVLYVTYNGISEGDQRARYYADKHASYPPDIERSPHREYVYRV